MHAKIKQCLLCSPLYGGCPHLGGSVKGGSTVHVIVLIFQLLMVSVYPLLLQTVHVIVLIVQLLMVSVYPLLLQRTSATHQPEERDAREDQTLLIGRGRAGEERKTPSQRE